MQDLRILSFGKLSILVFLWRTLFSANPSIHCVYPKFSDGPMTLSRPTRELIFNCPFIPVWAYGSKAQSFFSFFFSRSSFHTSKIVFWVKFSIASEVLESKAHMEGSWIIGRWELRMFKLSSRTGWSVLSRYAGKYISFLCLGQDHLRPCSLVQGVLKTQCSNTQECPPWAKWQKDTEMNKLLFLPVDAGDWIQVLWKSKKRSQPLSHSPAPELLFWVSIEKYF